MTQDGINTRMRTHHSMTIGDAVALDGLWHSQAEWSQETFGSDAERGPVGSLRHLELEAREAIDATSPEHFAEEMADCLLLVIDAARRGGMSLPALINRAVQKHAVCRGRTYWKVAEGEVSRHV